MKTPKTKKANTKAETKGKKNTSKNHEKQIDMVMTLEVRSSEIQINFWARGLFAEKPLHQALCTWHLAIFEF